MDTDRGVVQEWFGYLQIGQFSDKPVWVLQVFLGPYYSQFTPSKCILNFKQLAIQKTAFCRQTDGQIIDCIDDHRSYYVVVSFFKFQWSPMEPKS
jgi:hypothetical protein